MSGAIIPSALFEAYGQSVELIRQGEARAVRAFLQPIYESGRSKEQFLPTPLGARREDRFLYLGPPDCPLDAQGGTAVRWRGEDYCVLRCHPVCVAERTSHWWAVLAPEGAENGDGNGIT